MQQKVIDPPDVQEITIQNKVSAAYSSRGYDQMAVTEHANYYFQSQANFDEMELIKRSEIILQTAIEQYHIQPMVSDIKICFQDNSVRYLGLRKPTYVEINSNDEAQVGMLLYFISGGKLPVWLCSGLERYWVNLYDGTNSQFDLKG